MKQFLTSSIPPFFPPSLTQDSLSEQLDGMHGYMLSAYMALSNPRKGEERDPDAAGLYARGESCCQWSLPPWTHSKAVWTLSWAPCPSWPCLCRGVRPADLQRSLPAPTILGYQNHPIQMLTEQAGSQKHLGEVSGLFDWSTVKFLLYPPKLSFLCTGCETCFSNTVFQRRTSQSSSD